MKIMVFLLMFHSQDTEQQQKVKIIYEKKKSNATFLTKIVSILATSEK